MADIRQNTDVTGKLTVEGGGASTPFEVKGSNDSGVTSYTQFKLTDQNTGTLLELFNQAGTSEFKVSTTGTQIGGVYTLPHDAPDENQILTRATGAGAGVLSWEDNVADADSIGGYPVDLTANGGVGSGSTLFYSTANGGEWHPGTIPTPTYNLNNLTDVSLTTAGNGDWLYHNGTSWVNVDTDTAGNTILGSANLSDLSDVTQVFAADGNVLAYSGSGWVNSALSTELNAHAELANIKNVSNAAANDGDVLTWDNNAGKWAGAQPSGGATELNDLSDVNLVTTAATDDDVLVYDTDSFVPKALNLQTVTDVSGTTTNFLFVNNATGVLSTGGFTATAGNIQASTGNVIAAKKVQGTANSEAGVVGVSGTLSHPAIESQTTVTNPNVNAAVGLELQKGTLGDGSNVFLPAISWTSQNSGSSQFEAANIYTYLTDDTSGSEDAMLCIKTVEAGTVQIAAEFNGGMKIYNHDETGQPNDDFVIYNPTTSPANDDATGTIVMRGKNSANADTDFVKFIGGAPDVTSTAEDGAAVFQVMKNGTMTEVLEFSYHSGIGFYNNKYIFPDAVPTEGQVLVAGSVDPENLEWGSAGGGNPTYNFDQICYNSVTTSTDLYYWLPGSTTYGFEFYDNNELSSLSTSSAWNRYKKMSHRLPAGTYDLDFSVDISITGNTAGSTHEGDYEGEDIEVYFYKVDKSGSVGNAALTQIGVTQYNTQDSDDTANSSVTNYSVSGETFDGTERIMVVLKGTVSLTATSYAHWTYDIQAEKTA